MLTIIGAKMGSYSVYDTDDNTTSIATALELKSYHASGLKICGVFDNGACKVNDMNSERELFFEGSLLNFFRRLPNYYRVTCEFLPIQKGDKVEKFAVERVDFNEFKLYDFSIRRTISMPRSEIVEYFEYYFDNAKLNRDKFLVEALI